MIGWISGLNIFISAVSDNNRGKRDAKALGMIGKQEQEYSCLVDLKLQI